MLKNFSRPALKLYKYEAHLLGPFRTLATHAKMSWLPISEDSPFSIHNLPFGIITSKSSQTQKRPAVAIGDHVLDLLAFSKGDGFVQLPSIQPHLEVFAQPTLNAFAALGRETHRAVRGYLHEIFTENTEFGKVLKDNEELRKQALLPKHETKTHLPMQIGDYTDFYAGLNHAFNVGTMFRGPANALQPNYHHIPIGYHGRASSIVVSGSRVRRPYGQIILDPIADPKTPTFAPCRRLDIELELGCFLCKSNRIGEPINIDDAEDAIFGYVLLNDWSARDIQQWEYIPLGPFNGKNFATTISPWVVLADALNASAAPKLKNETKVLPYLEEKNENTVHDIALSVDLTTPDGSTSRISSVSSSNLLWSFPQMIASHSSGGCPMNIGDLLGSGTISGKNEKGGDLGSMLEMSQGGKKEILLAGMDSRTFLKDGDTITIRGVAGKKGAYVGFGECTGTIESAVAPGYFQKK